MKKQKLTPLQAEFVRQYVENGGNGSQAALVAGYKADVARNMAYRLIRTPHVLEALREEADRRIKSSVVIGATTLESLAKGAQSESVRLQAALALLDRGGLQLKALSEHKVILEDKRSDDELRARVEQLTRELGLKTIDMEAPKRAALPVADVTDVEVK